MLLGAESDKIRISYRGGFASVVELILEVGVYCGNNIKK